MIWFNGLDVLMIIRGLGVVYIGVVEYLKGFVFFCCFGMFILRFFVGVDMGVIYKFFLILFLVFLVDVGGLWFDDVEVGDIMSCMRVIFLE